MKGMMLVILTAATGPMLSAQPVMLPIDRYSGLTISSSVKQTVAIEFYTEVEVASLINITDETGRSVMSEWMITDKGKNRITWNGTDVNGVAQRPGVYLIDLSIGESVIRRKIVVR